MNKLTLSRPEQMILGDCGLANQARTSEPCHVAAGRLIAARYIINDICFWMLLDVWRGHASASISETSMF